MPVCSSCAAFRPRRTGSSRGRCARKVDPCNWKELESSFFIGMSESSYPGYRAWLTQTCQRVGFSPRVLQDAEIERTLFQAVAAGLGVALMPAQAKRLPHDDVLFCELAACPDRILYRVARRQCFAHPEELRQHGDRPRETHALSDASASAASLCEPGSKGRQQLQTRSEQRNPLPL